MKQMGRRDFLKIFGLASLGGALGAPVGGAIGNLSRRTLFDGPRGDGLSAIVSEYDSKGNIRSKHLTIGRTYTTFDRGPVYLIERNLDDRLATIYIADPKTLELIDVIQGRVAPWPLVNTRRPDYGIGNSDYHSLMGQGYGSLSPLLIASESGRKEQILAEAKPKFRLYLNKFPELQHPLKGQVKKEQRKYMDPETEYKILEIIPKNGQIPNTAPILL